MFDTIWQFYISYICPILDICFLAFILYKIFGIIQKTNSMPMLSAAIVMLALYALTVFLHLDTIRWIINALAAGLIVAVAIVFQPELRKIFLSLGNTDFFKRFNDKQSEDMISSVTTAAEELSRWRRGMLVVFERKNSLPDSRGTPIDAVVSSALLLTIFRYDTALHDGAVIIRSGRITEAGAVLPLTNRQDIKKTFGTRHRAAIGLSEESDAVILVVSEETGAMSLACDSKFYYDLSIEQITEILKKELVSFDAEKSLAKGNKDV